MIESYLHGVAPINQLINTIANAVSTDNAREEWLKNAPLTPYEFIVRTFEKSSYSSGLFGPVTLKK